MMKVIIPFKFDSTRLPNKNIIEFAGGKSLLDISVGLQTEILKKRSKRVVSVRIYIIALQVTNYTFLI
jgi:CMP-N-acetylneuraminic acid synthetase